MLGSSTPEAFSAGILFASAAPAEVVSAASSASEPALFLMNLVVDIVPIAIPYELMIEVPIEKYIFVAEIGNPTIKVKVLSGAIC